MRMILRQANAADRAAVELVESQSTPNLRYLPAVFDEFVNDADGDFSVAEVDGQIVGCAKFTALPDGSAWLEALRVMPSQQGKGIGKPFYRRFFEAATRKNIKTMRMYTGVRNKVSKGLAEFNGFTLAATCRGTSKAAAPVAGGPEVPFHKVNDPKRAIELLMPLKEKWGGFVVMNRTFYELTPALCSAWAIQGNIYEEPVSGSFAALGARFMPEQALHLAAYGGDVTACLAFAARKVADRGAAKVQCMFPTAAVDIQETLLANGFQLDQSDYIVMEVRL